MACMWKPEDILLESFFCQPFGSWGSNSGKHPYSLSYLDGRYLMVLRNPPTYLHHVLGSITLPVFFYSGLLSCVSHDGKGQLGPPEA